MTPSEQIEHRISNHEVRLQRLEAEVAALKKAVEQERLAAWAEGATEGREEE